METGTRPARRDDVTALATLMVEFYEEAGFALSDDAAAHGFTCLLDDPRLGETWVVEQDGIPVGYLVLTFGFSMEFGGMRGFVDDFFVRPGARGRGLGGAALDTIRRACGERGIRALLVETGPDDHRARPLYARAGFEANGRVFLSQALASAVHEPHRPPPPRESVPRPEPS